jgi:hypothetical protein
MLLKSFLPAVTLAALLIAPASAFASSITWGAATNISGDADVSTTGALVGAFNVGGAGVSGTTVNGVLFSPFALGGTSATAGDFTFTNASGFGTNSNTGSANAPFASLSAGYQALLSSALSQIQTDSVLTMTGLTPGDTYAFEWWANISTTGSTQGTAATNGNTVSLALNTGAAGGLGQFAIGTFTADGTGTETVTFGVRANSSFYMLNGFELRDVAGSTAVPEPATLLLLGTGLAAVARRVRRQRPSL